MHAATGTMNRQNCASNQEIETRKRHFAQSNSIRAAAYLQWKRFFATSKDCQRGLQQLDSIPAADANDRAIDIKSRLEVRTSKVSEKFKRIERYRQSARSFATAGNISQASKLFDKALAVSGRGSGAKACQFRAALLAEHSKCLASKGDFAGACGLAHQSLQENPNDRNMFVRGDVYFLVSSCFEGQALSCRRAHMLC